MEHIFMELKRTIPISNNISISEYLFFNATP